MDHNPQQNEWLSAAECASQTGLTIRALRLYERNGLLAPRRTGKNWRLYGVKDLERLNEIIILKGFGLTLVAISKLLAGKEANLLGVLELQHAALVRSRECADRSIALIDGLRDQIAKSDEPNVKDLIQLAKEMHMTQMTSEAVAWKRYEQSRPRSEIKSVNLIFEDYVGAFKLDDRTAVEIKQRDGGLAAQVTGQPAIDIYPEQQDNFFFKVVPAQLSFSRDKKGAVTGLVLHQDGFDKAGKRISMDEARGLEEALVKRINDNKPFPDSQAILEKLIAEAIAGKVDWSAKEAEFRLATEMWMPTIKTWLEGMGAFRQHKFLGVNASGWDVYQVSFEKADLHWSFSITKNGLIDGELIKDMPKI